MTTLATILKQSTSADAFATAYLQHLRNLLSSLDTPAITEVAEHLSRARTDGRTIFLIGNGGSAATASHMANDLGMCHAGTDAPGFRAHALTDAVAIMTAIANDFGYEDMFVRQLEIHYRPGDVLLAISASGNSPNLLAAAAWVRARGGIVLGFLGFSGGALKDLCNSAVIARTEAGEYGPVEDIHLILDHLITLWLRRCLREGA